MASRCWAGLDLVVGERLACVLDGERLLPKPQSGLPVREAFFGRNDLHFRFIAFIETLFYYAGDGGSVRIGDLLVNGRTRGTALLLVRLFASLPTTVAFVFLGLHERVPRLQGKGSAKKRWGKVKET